jgi:hypothetical protein
MSADPITAAKIRGCFIGIPGSSDPHIPRPVERNDVHLVEVAVDLTYVAREWWKPRDDHIRPEIANSDRSFWGMLPVRQRCVENFCCSQRPAAYCRQCSPPYLLS